MGAVCSTDKAVETRPFQKSRGSQSDLATGPSIIKSIDIDASSTPSEPASSPAAIIPARKKVDSNSTEIMPPTIKESEQEVVEKTSEVKDRIRGAIIHSFLVTDLDEEQKAYVVEAMLEKVVQPGEVIIREQEAGDCFYVIESGTFAASVQGKKVFVYEEKGAFGELALMYNCPRAATVQATTDGILWGLDRSTFRSIMVATTLKRRQAYESVLATMSIFSSLTVENRAAIADCLTPQTFKDGEYILKENGELSSDANFYLLDSGTVHCFKTFKGTRRKVKELEGGTFFGEMALINNAPRAADCVAVGEVKVLLLARDAFERLMGPVESVLAERIKEYKVTNLAVNRQTDKKEDPTMDEVDESATELAVAAPAASFTLTEIDNAVVSKGLDIDAPREYSDVVPDEPPCRGVYMTTVKATSKGRPAGGTSDY